VANSSYNRTADSLAIQQVRGRPSPSRGWIVLALLLAAGIVALSGCMGIGGGGEEPADTTVVSTSDTLAEGDAETQTATTLVSLDSMSTFKSKDPFVQQALPPTTTTTGSGGTTSTTTTTGSSTSTTESGTTSTTQPSEVDTPLHSLRVLSIDVINDTPVVTFEVDGTVYEDREIGDIVSTSWGDIEVVDIDAGAQLVTFLHGSETRILGTGQEFLK